MPSTDAPFNRIAICGVGLIGGSLGLAIKRRWPSVHVVAVDVPAVVEAAKGMGAADSTAGDVEETDAELVVLAAPIGANISLLPRVANALGRAALITDTGSTKRGMMTAAQTLGATVRFVGGHPVAGAARGGIKAARPDLFAGRSWILTPADGDGIPPALRTLLEGIGASVRVMSPETHDRLLSAVSHLPQLTASALMHVVASVAGAEGLALAGPGLRDTTRLASSPADVWRDIAATNQDHLGRDLDALVAALQDLRGDLGGATGALDRTFESAAAGKRLLDAHPESQTTATRTYLEMREPSALAAAPRPDPAARVERVLGCPPSFWRYLYVEVGRQYHWIDRLGWTDADIAAYLGDSSVSLWLLTVSSAPAGYFELKRHDDGSIEIAYFGLLEAYLGRGLGGYLLTEATREAWAAGATRVWLHTSTLDHAHAKRNYMRRGFVVFATEEYEVTPI